MPKLVLPDAEDFAYLERELIALGFKGISKQEFRADFERFNLVAPRPRLGREAGFKFSAHGLTVRVWTTWLREAEVARDEDAGWVLIEDGGRARYFGRPIHRTKSFVTTMLRQAWIAKWRVVNRPICPECRNFMDITFGKGLKSRYWACDKLALHACGEPHRRDWDAGLPAKALAYVKGLRKMRARARKRLLSDGNPHRKAMEIRRPWRRNAG